MHRFLDRIVQKISGYIEGPEDKAFEVAVRELDWLIKRFRGGTASPA
jgi:hypothetical protein